MKHLRLFALALFICGCSSTLAQVSQKQVTVLFTWNAPTTGCTSGCQYVISTMSVANGTATCPAATGTNYTPVNEAAPVSQTSYTYLAPTPGTSMCAVVQAYNGQYSVPSAPSNVVVIPVAPGAPTAPQGAETAASLAVPSNKQLAMLTGVAVWR